MERNYDQIKAAGAQLIAISSDNEAATQQTVKAHSLMFPVLADEDRTVIEAYNVLDPGNARIARPASYVLRADGTIAWKALNGLADRVPTAEILAELGKL